MASIWEEFGVAVKMARANLNLTGKELAFRAFGRHDRKSYVALIERGSTRLSARTVAKLAKALDLPESVTAPLFRAHLPDEDKIDTDARRLMQMAAADQITPGTADALMVALAYEFAQGSHLELATAYTALRGALQAAQDLKDQIARLHNMDDRLTAVLRRVADLNDRGLRDEAGEALEAAIKGKEAELETLFDAALLQDRLRNNPAAAAARLIARLRASAPPGGLFLATHRLLIETRERGERQGDPYDLAVALDLARANHDRARGPQVAVALNDLGNCHLALGERQSGGGHLTRARDAHAEALRLTQRRRDPLAWAGFQNNLGNALQRLGDRTADAALLRQAVEAHRAALTVQTRDATPMDWATSQICLGCALQTLGERTADAALFRQAVAAHRAALTVRTPKDTPMDWAASQNNLGLALRWLGAVTRDAAVMDAAAVAYADCLTERPRDAAPFFWAMTQWNLADLALARHALSPDQGHLATARHHLDAAREVFSDEGNDHQLAECDRLQALIDAAPDP